MKNRITSASVTAYGVDGCPKGWFFIALRPDRGIDWGVVQTVRDLLTKTNDSDRIFIDIPIGLLDSPQERLCDKEARGKLGRPLSSSVFPAPARATINAVSYEEACEKNQEKTGKKLSRQTLWTRLGLLFHTCPYLYPLLKCCVYFYQFNIDEQDE